MQTKEIKLSYIIAVFNKAKYVAKTIESITKQSSNINKEIIIINDCSTDNSMEVVKTAQEKYKDIVDIIIIENQKNSGPSISNNNGIRYAKGEFLFFIDGDDVLIENIEQKLIDIAIKAKVDFIVSKDIKTSKFDFTIKAKKTEDYTKYQGNCLQKLLKLKFNYSLFASKRILEKCNNFDERIFVQDVNIFLKLAINSNSFVYLNEPKVQILVNDDTSKESHNLIRQHVCGFYAYKYSLEQYVNTLSSKDKKLLMQKAISVMWKFVRRNKNYNIFHKTIIFIHYIARKITTKYGYCKAQVIFKQYNPFILK